MSSLFTLLSAVVVLVVADHSHSHHGHHHHKSHGHLHSPHKTHELPPPPKCSEGSDKPYCLEDDHYPVAEIEQAGKKHVHKLLAMYADVADLNDALSVDRADKPSHVDAGSLCPSAVAFIRPLRAVNTQGKWRIVINDVTVGYEKLTQTTRVEDCLTAGDACPLVPSCLTSTCLQKSVYHRYLIYDPYDPYFPFAVESFQLPSSCACHLEEYNLLH